MKRSPIQRTGILGLQSHARLSAGEPKRRTRKCVICRAPFEPRSMTHKACSADCAIAHLDRLREAKARSERRAGLAKLKRKADWLREAQAAFNAFIRLRDAALPCISCGRFHDGKYDAGHYRSVGAMPALRFHELNVHKQCVPCNQHKGGNIVEYRLGLIARIGVEAVEMLERDYPPAKYTVDDAQAIKATYKQKLKELQP